MEFRNKRVTVASLINVQPRSHLDEWHEILDSDPTNDHSESVAGDKENLQLKASKLEVVVLQLRTEKQLWLLEKDKLRTDSEASIQTTQKKIEVCRRCLMMWNC